MVVCGSVWWCVGVCGGLWWCVVKLEGVLCMCKMVVWWVIVVLCGFVGVVVRDGGVVR